MSVEQRIRIVCKSSILSNCNNKDEGSSSSSSSSNNNKDAVNQAEWRSWKVSIYSVRPQDGNHLKSYVDRVEYFLHPSFDASHQICTEEPYTLERVGWGAFMLKIIFHLKDPSVPAQTMLFDLNFNKENYCVYRTLPIIHAGKGYIENGQQQQQQQQLLSAKRETTTLPPLQSESNHDKNPTTKKRKLRCKKETITTSLKLYSTVKSLMESKSHAPSREEQEQEDNSNNNSGIISMEQQGGCSSAITTTTTTSTSTSTDTNANTTTSTIAAHEAEAEAEGEGEEHDLLNDHLYIEKIRYYKELGTWLESLDDDRLRSVYQIMLQYDTSRMRISETNDGYYLIDLWSLCPELLKRLWLEMQRTF